MDIVRWGFIIIGLITSYLSFRETLTPSSHVTRSLQWRLGSWSGRSHMWSRCDRGTLRLLGPRFGWGRCPVGDVWVLVPDGVTVKSGVIVSEVRSGMFGSEVRTGGPGFEIRVGGSRSVIQVRSSEIMVMVRSEVPNSVVRVGGYLSQWSSLVSPWDHTSGGYLGKSVGWVLDTYPTDHFMKGTTSVRHFWLSVRMKKFTVCGFVPVFLVLLYVVISLFYFIVND